MGIDDELYRKQEGDIRTYSHFKNFIVRWERSCDGMVALKVYEASILCPKIGILFLYPEKTYRRTRSYNHAGYFPRVHEH